MFVIDYEDVATIAGADGIVHPCTIVGLAKPDNPGVAGLGHSPTALAEQFWSELTLHIPEELNFENGDLTFTDGSRCVVELLLKSTTTSGYLYALTLKAP